MSKGSLRPYQDAWIDVLSDQYSLLQIVICNDEPQARKLIVDHSHILADSLGNGISSIEYSLNKCEGAMKFNVEDDRFTLNIIIAIPNLVEKSKVPAFSI